MHAKGVVLCERTRVSVFKHLLSAFYETLPSKNPVFAENPYRRLLRTLYFQKSLGVHKILVRKIWFYPPPLERAQNEEKLYKSVENRERGNRGLVIVL